MAYFKIMSRISFCLMLYMAFASLTLIGAILFAPAVADHCGVTWDKVFLAILCFLVSLWAWRTARCRAMAAAAAVESEWWFTDWVRHSARR